VREAERKAARRKAELQATLAAEVRRPRRTGTCEIFGNCDTLKFFFQMIKLG